MKSDLNEAQVQTLDGFVSLVEQLDNWSSLQWCDPKGTPKSIAEQEPKIIQQYSTK